jgi:hypothetical protein
MPLDRVPPVAELAELIVEIDRRLTALEAAVGAETARADELAEKEAAREDELSKLAWAAKHGRQRPW